MKQTRTTRGAGVFLLVAGLAAASGVGPARGVARLDLKRALQVD